MGVGETDQDDSKGCGKTNVRNRVGGRRNIVTRGSRRRRNGGIISRIMIRITWKRRGKVPVH
eukprot:3966664-Pyramimonas_sp.AAC.1